MDPDQFFTEDKVQIIISRLKFLSKIKRGEKINIREFFVRDNDSIIQRFLRTIHNFSTYMSASEVVESKEATLVFIQSTVNDAITLISIYQHNNGDFQQRIANIIVENLEKSKNGIRNLIATYQNDRRFISNTEAVMQTLDARVKSVKSNGYMQGITNSSFMPESLEDDE